MKDDISSPKMLERFLKLKDKKIKHGAFILKRTTPVTPFGGAAMTRAQRRKRLELEDASLSHDEEGLSSEKKKKKRRSSNDEEEEKEQEERQKTTTSRSSSAADSDSRERPLSLSDDYKRRRTLPVVGTRLATHDEVQSRNEEPSSKNKFSSLRLRQKNHDLGKIISSVGKTIRKQGNTLIL